MVRKHRILYTVTAAILAMSVGFSALNESLSISGEATVRANADVRITALNYGGSENGGYEKYKSEYTRNTTNTVVSLPNANSTVTYTAKVKNNSDGAYKVDAIALEIQSNTNVSYEIVGLAVDDVLAPGEEKTFEIRLATNAAEQEGTIRLKYEFSEFEANDCLLMSGSMADIVIGSEIDCGGEQFYVISSDGESVTMLAKYNLHVGRDYTSRTVYTDVENPTGLQNSRCVGWVKDGYPYYCTTPFRDGADDSDYTLSTIKPYVDAYAQKLKEMKFFMQEVRLITHEEINVLCGQSATYNDYFECATTYPWMYSTTYWSQSAGSSSTVWYVGTDRFVRSNYGASRPEVYGVRPVVKISKDDLKESESCIVQTDTVATLKIGSEINCGGEQFYIYKIEDGKVYGLAKWNLHVGRDYASDSEYTEIANPTGLQDNGCVGYPSDGGHPRYCTVPFRDGMNNSDYATSTIKTYVDAYAQKLAAMKFPMQEVRLIAREEINVLCGQSVSYNSNFHCATTYPWVYSTSYWSWSVYSSTTVWAVNARGVAGSNYTSHPFFFGVRPVVEISADRLKDPEKCSAVPALASGLAIGDEFSCGDQNFYVYKTDSDYIYGLTEYNLKVGGNYESDYVALGDAATNMQSSECRGYLEGVAKRSCTTAFGEENASYSGSTVQTYVENYRKIMAQKNYGFEEMRLIERTELSSLCGLSDTEVAQCATDYLFIYQASYWTSAVRIANSNWGASTDRYLRYAAPTNNNHFGVRPVVKIARSKIDVTTPENCLVTSGRLSTLAIGNTFKCGTEEFYVTSVSGTKVTAIAKYNLKAGGDYDGSNLNLYNSSQATYMQDSACVGGASGTCVRDYSSHYKWVNYFGSYAEEYTTNYKNKLIAQKYSFSNMRLITRPEISTLCSATDTVFGANSCATTYPWAYTTSYWTQTAYTEERMWALYHDTRHIAFTAPNDNRFYGVRPVVEIDKSRLEDKKCEVTSGSLSNLQTGDQIRCDTEEFYIMSNDGTNVTALAKYNLHVGRDYTSESEYTNITNPTNLQNSRCLGMPSDWSYPRYCTVLFRDGAYNSDYASSTIKPYVDAYAQKLAAMYYDIQEVRLITHEEMNVLCGQSASYNNNVTCVTTYPWMYSTSYWSQSASSSTSVWYMYANRLLTHHYSAFEARFGVRPVIN